MSLLLLLFILFSIVPLEAAKAPRNDIIRAPRILHKIKAATQYTCSECNKLPKDEQSQAMQRYGGFRTPKGFKNHATRVHPLTDASAILILRKKQA